MKIYIGCSGYSYNDWTGKFYPSDLSKSQWLTHYSDHFNTVEINNTFYKAPSQKVLSRWKEQTPPDFKFTIKAYRFFTHMKKLKVDDAFLESLHMFQDTISIMHDKMGCMLWQLPRNLKMNLEKLGALSSNLDHSVHHVIEFRDLSWFNEEVYQALEQNQLAYCMLSAPGKLPEDTRATGPAAYLRFHGKSKWYHYLYSDEELMDWKKKLQKLKGIEELYIYFNNDVNAHAVENALSLRRMMKA